jgi:hypothetical protein
MVGFLCLIWVAIWAGPCLALDLGISPPDISIQISPGQTYQGEIFVFGSDRETTQVTIFKNDWFLTSAGAYQFLPMGTVKRSAAPWVTIQANRLSLAPKTGQRVQYTLKVPADASGSYWTALMFSTVPAAAPGNGRFQIAMSGRVAYIMRIDVNGSAPGRGSIERFHLNWDAKQQKIVAALRVKNSGESFVRFKGRLEIRDNRGRIVNVLSFGEGLILPGSAQEFRLQEYSFHFQPGYYVGLAVADLGDQSLKAVQTTFQVK